MLMSFVAMAVIGVQWIAFGYALAFGKSQGGFIGWQPDLFFLSGIEHTRLYADKGIPELVFVMFQGKFAIIAPALISGAVAERMRFRSYLLFIGLWATFVYCPLAHWVWASDGWLFKMGILDFAGGAVVHVAAGVSALVLALMLGARRDVQRGAPILPNNLVLTLTGAGLLWFGWFGFNAGSAVAVERPVAGSVAGLAFATTQTAAATAALMWLFIERWHHRKVTSLGIASGLVAGLVAITPAAGHVQPWAAMLIGAAASVVCYGAVQLKTRLRYDDSLDAFGVHGVGGFLGAVLTGVFCFIPVAGGLEQFGKQVLGASVATVFAGAGTFVLAKVVEKIFGLRVSEQAERDGLDIAIHGERGYHFDQV